MPRRLKRQLTGRGRRRRRRCRWLLLAAATTAAATVRSPNMATVFIDIPSRNAFPPAKTVQNVTSPPIETGPQARAHRTTPKPLETRQQTRPSNTRTINNNRSEISRHSSSWQPAVTFATGGHLSPDYTKAMWSILLFTLPFPRPSITITLEMKWIHRLDLDAKIAKWFPAPHLSTHPFPLCLCLCVSVQKRKEIEWERETARWNLLRFTAGFFSLFDCLTNESAVDTGRRTINT